ncbi:MAG: tetratricopeptide repeat protein, partial [Candidatus Riflebacteria bacterium]|nr:tetratricopeptide repeat protein [Candidatus Riflebacteria bacterium]
MVYHYIGDCYVNLQQYEKANEYYTKTLKFSDYEGLHSVYEHRALMYIDLKEYQKALSDINKAIELKPSGMSVYYKDRSHIYNLLGEDEKSAIDFEYWCQCRINSIKDMLKAQSYEDKVQILLHFFSSLNSEEQDIFLAETLFDYNLDEEDDECENTNIQIPSVNKLSVLEQARDLLLQKQFKACISLLENEYDELEKDAEANNMLGMCYFHINNINESMHYNDKAIKIEEKPDYFYNRGYYSFKCGLFIDAIKCYNQALKLSDNDEKESRFITKEIINFVNAKTKFFNNYDLKNNDALKEYILY